MSTFQQMQDDLSLLGMANLIQTDLGTLLNKCNREEVEAWSWSWLYSNQVIWGIAPYSTGTLNLQPGSSIAVGSGTTFLPSMAGYWLSVGATLTTPIIVSTFIDQSTLQLGTPWAGAAGSSYAYSLFPLYYDVFPIGTIHRVRQINYLVESSIEELNRIDPSRVSTGGNPSLRWAKAPYTNDSPPHTQVELWPRPSSPLPYIIDGKLTALDMINPNDWPQVPSMVLEAKAAMYMARSVYASNGNPKWMQLADSYRDDYLRERDNARIEDNRKKITLGLTSKGAYGVNLGEDYYAIHDAYGPPEP